MSVQVTQNDIKIKETLVENKQKYGAYGKRISEYESFDDSRKLFNLGRKNLIINGNFDIWQRGTSFANNNDYTVDRWISDSTVNTTDRSSDVPNSDSKYSVKITADAGANSNIYTSIELLKTGEMYPIKPNTQYTISFYVKATPGADINFRAEFRDTTIGFNSVSVFPNVPISVATGDWQYVSKTFDVGTTVPNATNSVLELGIIAVLPDSIMYVSQVQLEEGGIATPFEYRPISKEIEMCQRYYQKSYNLETSPGTVTNTGRIVEFSTRNNIDTIGFEFITPMRVVPTVTIYSTGTGAANMITNNGDKIPTVINVSETRVSKILVASGVTSSLTSFHYTALAEI